MKHLQFTSGDLELTKNILDSDDVPPNIDGKLKIELQEMEENKESNNAERSVNTEDIMLVISNTNISPRPEVRACPTPAKPEVQQPMIQGIESEEIPKENCFRRCMRSLRIRRRNRYEYKSESLADDEDVTDESKQQPKQKKSLWQRFRSACSCTRESKLEK